MTALLHTLFDRRRNIAIPAEDIRVTHACASWLITYPGDDLIEKIPTIAELVKSLDPRVGEPLQRTVSALSGDMIELREQYVDTFDTRRRGCLFLTYFSNGDTRRRGMALVRIKDAYRKAGLEVSGDELPDHLSLVLEFSASASVEAGMKILTQNRAGVELLRTHLEQISSPWLGAIEAVSETLPPMTKGDRERMVDLAAYGPEEELVGLDGYGDGHFDQIYPASRPGPSFCGTDAGADGAPAGQSPGPQPITLERSRP